MEASRSALDSLDNDGEEVSEKRSMKDKFVSRDEHLSSEERPRKHSVTRKKTSR